MYIAFDRLSLTYNFYQFLNNFKSCYSRHGISLVVETFYFHQQKEFRAKPGFNTIINIYWSMRAQNYIPPTPNPSSTDSNP